MNESHAAYARARDRVLAAQAEMPDGYKPIEGEEPPPEAVELADAHRELVEATEPVAAEVEAAWRANIDAIQAAKTAGRDAMRRFAEIEVEAGNAARKRNPVRPVLNADEMARVEAVQAEIAAAREAMQTAEVQFKQGVTAEQLEAVG